MAKGIMRSTLEKMLRDLKTVYTDTWFLPKDSWSSGVDAWYRALGNYTYDQLRAAFDVYIERESKSPMPSQIRDIIEELKGASERTPTFSESDYWTRYRYWVLTDLNGHIINELIAPASDTDEDVRKFFDIGKYPREGTILRPVDYRTYSPKYQRGNT